MSLPIYQTITIKSSSFEELEQALMGELNLKHPVIFNVRALAPDQQRETIGLIENHFVNADISFKFPYPVYVMTEHESAISGLALVKSQEQLPKFFAQREGKINVKESHLMARNKLLQQEVRNGDNVANETEMKIFAKIHRQVYLLEEERLFYRSLLNRLSRAKANG